MIGPSVNGPELEEVETIMEPIQEMPVPSSIRGKRRRKLPARFHDKAFTHDKRVPLPRHHVDEIPEPLSPVSSPDPPSCYLPRVVLIVRDTIRTALNVFGLM